MMNKYRVSIKYGDPGKSKSNTQTITVEAESDATAMKIAESKFRSSISSYRNKEVDVVRVEKL